MPGRRSESGVIRWGQGPFVPVYLPTWEYLGGETLTGFDGTVWQWATLPTDAQGNVTATIFQIDAEGAETYYHINASPTGCDPNSPGFCPQNGGRVVGPLHNLLNLAVCGANGAIVHLMYFREGP